MPALAQINRIVVLMMENRSFDHLLGYLSLPEFGGLAVDGLKAPFDPAVFGNPARWDEKRELPTGPVRLPFPMPDRELPHDLPHERKKVTRQLAELPVSGLATMKGFAAAYAFAEGESQNTTKPEPMGYCTPADIPVTDFLARNYAVCDRWFAPLPTSTQPNRLMALSGFTRIDETDKLIPDQPTVLDWMGNRVRWRVYHAGFSFMTLMSRYWDDLLAGERFRWFDELEEDIAKEGPDEFPQVIFIEPAYADAPIEFNWPPNDNHPPLPLAPGEDFIRAVYQVLTSNEAIWNETALIITYDEHGGFFDHVVPPSIVTAPPPKAKWKDKTPFKTLGVRVPALIVSPYVNPGTVCSELFDHTSILQFIAEQFAPDKNGFSDDVNRRRDATDEELRIQSVAKVFNRVDPRPPVTPPQATQHGKLRPEREPSANSEAFAAAASSLLKKRKKDAIARYKGLDQWKKQHG